MRTKLIVLAAAWFCTFLTPAVLHADTSRPNILVIMSDEHNAGVLGCYGNTVVKTPNLDRLAAEGIRFSAAYTNSPLCVPSRLAFTAGKYVSRVGAWNNDCELPSADYPSIARVMTAAGYDSALCGKMHYERSRRYGFSDVGQIGNSSIKTGRGFRRPPEKITAGPLSERFQNFHPGDASSVMQHDLKVTAGAKKFLAERKGSDKPFFLLAGYLAPHFPLIVPQKYWDMYKGKVPLPVIPPGHLASQPLNYQHLRAGFSMAGVPEDTVRKGRELYYGLTTWVDEQIGELLAQLKASGLAENTVIIYTTDHGENLGEHGLWWKNCLYDSAARIPLIISWPKRWKGGQVRTGACSLVDVVQTVAELGGTRSPADWNGASLAGWMDDPAAKWKDLAVSEYYAHHIASGYAMIRMGDWKYVYHTPADAKHPAQRELYDLAADPGELTNLGGRAEQQERISRMHAALVKELGEEPDKTELRCRADFVKAEKEGKPKEAKRGGRGKGKRAAQRS